MTGTEPPPEDVHPAAAPSPEAELHPDTAAETEAAEAREESVLALSRSERPTATPVSLPEGGADDVGPSEEAAGLPPTVDPAAPHAGEDEIVASLAETPDEPAAAAAIEESYGPDEPTAPLRADPEADEVTTILPARSDIEADEPTTLVASPAEAGDDEVTTFLPAASVGELDEEEATTLLATSEIHDDEATTLVRADTDGQEDEPTFILPAPEPPGPSLAEQPGAPLPPDTVEGVTEIRPASIPADVAHGPPDWFTENLQHFTRALRQDGSGAPRAPQEVQQLALVARDMIARIAMQGGARSAAEGWAGDTVLQPDQLLANTYIVRSLIARGGIGEIYRTRHRDLRTEHAVKVLLPRYALDPTVLTLMQDEARLLACVRHEAVVRLQDLLRDADGRPMLVMDFLRGRTLSARLREGRLPTPDLVVLARRLAEGLTAIHAAGIVHQDISPDNVILADDSCGAATIIDFGLARRVGTGRDMHRNLDFAGKYSWSSPEQLSGRPAAVDARSDLYSLGLMLAAAARGYRLDMGQDIESARAARTTVPSLAGIEQPLAGLIEALLAPSPDTRLGSATDIEAMLEPRPRSLWARIAPYLGLKASV